MAILSDDQRAAIAEIVDAVHDGSYWRVGILLERFVADVDLSDLTGLVALRSALANDAAAVRP
ncbi:hypothetical protein V2W30_39095 [Streptomyces sp. Q6]|uniref:Uncharacterized protein n=1 Tax=Streptomyces citrinus TaxID=3118173 RepID=A0ACD5ANH2_9ACTN